MGNKFYRALSLKGRAAPQAWDMDFSTVPVGLLPSGHEVG